MQAVLLCKTDAFSPTCGLLRPETPRTPSRSTKIVILNQLLGTFVRKLASLKQCELVRIAFTIRPLARLRQSLPLRRGYWKPDNQVSRVAYF